MAGVRMMKRGLIPVSLAFVGAMLLSACDENGEFAFPTGDTAAGADTETPRRTIQTSQGERDVERPDVFDITDRGLWDGRPSLGGVWVAHPDVQDPERVIIRNPANGRSIVGALFRRERENPGPLLQVSSDAAEELGILAGAPTELSVIALRREETEVEETIAPQDNPVIASLAAPVSVEAAPLDPVAGAAAAIDAAEDAASPVVAVVLPPAEPSATALPEPAAQEGAVESTVDVMPVVAVAGDADLSGTQYQIGVFSVEGNANVAAQQLRDAGVPASVVTQQAGGRDVWRLMASPTSADDDPDTTLTLIKGLGFADAFLVESESASE
jgi:rare lipoprotein A